MSIFFSLKKSLNETTEVRLYTASFQFQSQLNPPLCSANQQPPGEEQIQGTVFVFVQVSLNPSTRRLIWSVKQNPFLPGLRDDVVDLTDCYQYEDNQTDDPDAFAREPYILHFKPRNTGERAGLGAVFTWFLLELWTDTIATSLCISRLESCVDNVKLVWRSTAGADRFIETVEAMIVLTHSRLFSLQCWRI